MTRNGPLLKFVLAKWIMSFQSLKSRELLRNKAGQVLDIRYTYEDLFIADHEKLSGFSERIRCTREYSKLLVIGSADRSLCGKTQ